MMYQEFLAKVDQTEKAVSFAQYEKLEAVYMNADESITQEVFCKAYRKIYTEIVGTAISQIIHLAPLEAKNPITPKLEAYLDNVREQKTQEVIEFLENIL